MTACAREAAENLALHKTLAARFWVAQRFTAAIQAGFIPASAAEVTKERASHFIGSF